MEQSLDNRRYEGNSINDDFDHLPFGGDERLIRRLLLYLLNDIILFS